MQSVSFIDFVFPQFPPQNWQSGIAIFNSDGVAKLQTFGELVSAKVKAGIGELYDVRLKLHAHGKCVQWMECTCQAYRRRGEKCGHLAALCLYLDQERSDILFKMNLSSGQSDRYLLGNYVANEKLPKESSPSEAFKDGNDDGDEISAASAGSRTWNSSLGKVTKIELGADERVLSVTVGLGKDKFVTYRLGPDDAFGILSHPAYFEMIPKKLQTLQAKAYTATRFFEVKKRPKAGLIISRMISVVDELGTVKKTFSLEEAENTAIGLNTLFHPKLGYVPFKDDMSNVQLSRWNEYPKTAMLDDDSAAGLFQTDFARLKETAEVVLTKELQKLRVFQAFDIKEIKLKSSADGKLIVEPNLSGLQLTLPDSRDDDKKPSRRFAESSLLAILKARAEGRQYLATKDGWLKLGDEMDWLKDKVSTDGQLKLSTLDFIKFREQFASGSEIVGTGDLVSRLRTGLIHSDDLEMPNLSGTQLQLRPYQEEGLRWLWWLYNNGLGGLLADEMGLGKTHQAMALLSGIAHREVNKVSLVVCPTSVIDHWLDKMQKFVPHTNVVFYHGVNRKQEAFKSPLQHTVIVTSYGILLRDILFLMECPWAIVILDEAHLVKNQTTRTYRAACKLQSGMRLCLTGTPLENDLSELKNLFDYIAPGYLGTDADFKRKYLTVSEVRSETVAELELQRLIHPFKMRRNKRDVLKDLPEKIEDIRYCHLKKEQHKLYLEALSLKGAPLVDAIQSQTGAIPYIHVFAVISLLKQICNDPALLDPRYEGVGSGKLDLFDELLNEALESDQKVVVFSQYAKMINRLSQHLQKKSIKHVILTGSSINRGSIVREFQENYEVKVFLGSLLAGGTGIDLTAGSVVIHFDRWWNAAKENQATDRIHRVGQGRNVQVYKLVTRGTLEERVDEIINRKRLIFDRFVDRDNEVLKHFSREDLLNLLAPPEELNDIADEEKENPLPDVDAEGYAQILDI